MRLGIGLSALAALGLGAFFALSGDDTLAGISARIGVILAALWVAHPVVTDVGPRTYLFGAIALIVLLWRPRSAVVVLPVLALALRRKPTSEAV